jgi:hypothetical protein
MVVPEFPYSSTRRHGAVLYFPLVGIEEVEVVRKGKNRGRCKEKLPQLTLMQPQLPVLVWGLYASFFKLQGYFSVVWIRKN